MQVPGDSVLALSSLTPYEFCNLITEKFAGTAYNIIVKQHPKDSTNLLEDCGADVTTKGPFTGLAELRRNIAERKCLLVNGNIHDLTTGAEGVFTVNSGVGLEALLLTRPVFVWGKSLYDYAATALPAIVDLPAGDILEGHPFDLVRSSKLVHYLLSETFVTLGDLGGAERIVWSALHQ